MSHVAVYTRLKDAVNSGSYVVVDLNILKREVKDGIHDYLCAPELSPDAATCSSCEALLAQPVEKENFDMICLLLEHGVYLSDDICAPGYAYRRKPPPPLLKLAVESGSLDDVRQMLSQGADVNAHPRLCVKDLLKRRSTILNDSIRSCAPTATHH